LVHGSGPQDRDETVGRNKPFRDLAWGLASQGIAVLRYDKRTLTHAARFATPKEPLTVKEEVIDDVLAAVALLHKNKAVDAKRIFVLGHSLGGILAPRIGKEAPDVAGLIILAGATRPLEDLILEQHTYLLSLDGPPSADGKAELEKIKAVVARIKDPKLSPEAPAAELFGGSGAYWLSLRDYHPAETARTLKQPLLILQGERDYQVRMTDFDGWKKALAERKDAELKSYAKLNHLFVEGEGAGTPAEYDSVGHVSKEVVDDVAAWIKKH
jgi:dienelactone hydrolase